MLSAHDTFQSGSWNYLGCQFILACIQTAHDVLHYKSQQALPTCCMPLNAEFNMLSNPLKIFVWFVRPTEVLQILNQIAKRSMTILKTLPHVSLLDIANQGL